MYVNEEKFGHLVKIKMTFSMTNHNICSMMSFCPIHFVLMNGILCHLWLSYLMHCYQICLLIYYFIVYISTDIVSWLPFILMHSSTYFVNRLSRTTSHTMSPKHCSHFNPLLCCSLPVSCLRSPTKASNMFNSAQVRA
jgi:hypothetical protein